MFSWRLADLSGLVNSFLGICLHFVVRVVGNLCHRLLKDGGGLSDGQRRVQVGFALKNIKHREGG